MQSFLTFLIPRLAWVYLHFVGKTSRIVWMNRNRRFGLENREGNFIYAFWHGRQVFITYAYRNLPVTCMVSKSKDGEYIARVIQHFGEQCVRGSSSRGGMRAVVEMKQRLEEGRTVGLTPDGPRGPQRTVADGILFLAQKSGKSILPLTYSSRRRLIFRGWDDYWIPLPFSRIVLNFGNPVSVSESDDRARKGEELKRSLDEITADADRRVEEDGSWFEIALYAIYDVLATILSPLIALGLFLRYPKTFLAHATEGLGERLVIGEPRKVPFSHHPVWVHASSLGECRAALPFIRAFRAAHPGQKILFTSTTPVGVREARRLGLGDVVRYAPIDCPFTVRRFLNAFEPRMLLLLESELWPNWLARAKDFGIPVGVINGRMSARSGARYKALSFIAGKLMQKLDFAAVREESDRSRYVAAGLPPGSATVTGNMKYDMAPWELSGDGSTPQEAQERRTHVWVAGSVREGEEELVLETHRNLIRKFPGLKLILAPRHTEQIGGVSKIIRSMQLKAVLRSQSAEKSFVIRDFEGDVLVWDTFGDLWKAYQSAGIAFIGGSLVPKGGQNPIEPAWFGMPILFGPSMSNFEQPADLLISNRAALQVKDRSELESKLSELLCNPVLADELGCRSKEVMEQFKGQATRNVMKIVEKYL